MKTGKYNTINWPWLSFMLLLLASSCAKWDDFKEYIKEGEITYVGRLDSVKVFPGKERVKISALLKPDPKIKQVQVFWNDRRDSTSFEVDGTDSNGIFEEVIPMTEGIVSLLFYTFDDAGNRSVAVPVVGRAYGSRYENGLTNRLIENAMVEEGVARIDWAEMDLGTGPFATEVKYLTSDNKEKTVRIPLGSEETEIRDLAPGEKTVAYRTLFLPQPTSIDTFYTEFTTVGLARDATDEYLRNTQVPMVVSSKSDRWGIPADWITNAATRNFRDGAGNYFGGVDFWFDGPFLAMEAGWSDDNMVSITNGKIYQQTTLPAGNYTFEMDIPDCTAGGDFYTVAALGDEIPDIENIASSIGFLKTNMPGTHTLSFLLTEESDVTLGFVGNLANKGAGDGTFWRITAVRLKQTVLTE